jgi:hypothetical protein
MANFQFFGAAKIVNQMENIEYGSKIVGINLKIEYLLVNSLLYFGQPQTPKGALNEAIRRH